MLWKKRADEGGWGPVHKDKFRSSRAVHLWQQVGSLSTWEDQRVVGMWWVCGHSDCLDFVSE